MLKIIFFRNTLYEKHYKFQGMDNRGDAFDEGRKVTVTRSL